MNVAIECHNLIHSKAIIDLDELMSDETTNINTHYKAYVGSISIDSAKYTNRNQVDLIKKLKRNGINNYYDLLREYKTKRHPSLWYEVLQVLASFPRSWRILILPMINREGMEIRTNNLIPIKMNIFKEINNITTKDIKETINRQYFKNKNETLRHIQTKHNLPINSTRENPFLTSLSSTKEVQLRNVQYKILHNIYPTMKHLFTWKIKESPNCTQCGEVETIKHAIAECTVARTTLSTFKTILEEYVNITINLTPESLILGVEAQDLNTQTPYIPAINTCLILIKRALILQRENKFALSIEQLKDLITNQIAKEKYNATKTKKLTNFELRWPTLLKEMGKKREKTYPDRALI
jgi:hypothetical protein